MRITTKGQVTIPAHIREKAGLMPHTEVEFILERNGKVVLSRSKGRPRKPTRGEKLIAHLKGRGDVRMTTDQIMKLTRG